MSLLLAMNELPGCGHFILILCICCFSKYFRFYYQDVLSMLLLSTGHVLNFVVSERIGASENVLRAVEVAAKVIRVPEETTAHYKVVISCFVDLKFKLQVNGIKKVAALHITYGSGRKPAILISFFGLIVQIRPKRETFCHA